MSFKVNNDKGRIGNFFIFLQLQKNHLNALLILLKEALLIPRKDAI